MACSSYRLLYTQLGENWELLCRPKNVRQECCWKSSKCAFYHSTENSMFTWYSEQSILPVVRLSALLLQSSCSPMKATRVCLHHPTGSFSWPVRHRQYSQSSGKHVLFLDKELTSACIQSYLGIASFAETEALEANIELFCLLCCSTRWQEISSQWDISLTLQATTLYTNPDVLVPRFPEYPQLSVWSITQQGNTIFPGRQTVITLPTYHSSLQGSGLSIEDVTEIQEDFPAFKINSSNTCADVQIHFTCHNLSSEAKFGWFDLFLQMK